MNSTHTYAHGRVNMLGEHTDYNGGFVLPIAIQQKTYIVLRENSEPHDEYFSRTLKAGMINPRDHMPADFALHLHGCIKLLERRGITIPPVYVEIDSDVPLGAGLSSSAALQVAFLRALNERYRLGLDAVDIALTAQKVEHEFVGVKCGIMDQMACSLASTDTMLFLDVQTLQYQQVALPENSEILIVHSGVGRELASSGYNTRRAECEHACELLGIASLRDISPAQVDTLPEPLSKRARHIYSENNRVKQALKADAVQFGALMNDSHSSMQHDYEASHPEVDALVAALQQHPQVYGARITGAGWGGCCVALVRLGQGDAVVQAVLPYFKKAYRVG